MARLTPGLLTKTTVAAVAAVLAGAASVAAAADSYPTRPVRLVVPFPPGGSNDIVGRMIAQQLSERLPNQVVVDNRAGAGGQLGTELVANARPDGYTLLVISAGYAFGTSLYKLKYDPVNSFVPIAKLGYGPNVAAVHPSLPVRSVKELVALAQKRPGELNFASAGVGSFQHLGSELFKMLGKVDIVHIPYKGGSPAMIGVISGQAEIVIGTLIQTLPNIRSGRLRGLATGGAKRASAAPDLPTMQEAGIAGYEASNWWGIITPAGTPAAVVELLSKELGTILAKPEIQKRFSNDGAEADYLPPAAFKQYIAAETAKWAKVVKAAGIKAR